MKRSLLCLSFLSLAASGAITELNTESPDNGAQSPMEAEAAADTDKTEAAAAEEPAAFNASAPSLGSEATAQNISNRLREKAAKIDEGMSSISKPSRSLISMVNNGKKRIESGISDVTKLSVQVNELQQKYNENNSGDFSFDVISSENRDRYAKDGAAAYKAMVVDMKQKKGSRKVGGLDKFEILRDRYQGIPEYRKAFDWYIKTLKDRRKQWTKLLEGEEGRRKKLQSDKASAYKEADDREWNKLKESLEQTDVNIENTWFNPSPRNLRMLQHCKARVDDTLRRNNASELDEHVGKVPDMINAYWAMMDKARELLVSGHPNEAADLLQDDETYKEILRLKTNLLPNEYREEMKKQYSLIQNEARKRARAYRDLKSKLERQSQQLENKAATVEAQIDSLLESIGEEEARDIGSNTEQDDETAPQEDKPKEAAPKTKEQDKEDNGGKA